MRKIQCDIDVDMLNQAIMGATFKRDGTGIMMANGQWNGVPKWVEAVLPHYLLVLFAGIGEPRVLKHVMVNTIMPGGGSGTHSDPSPGGVRHERWHLPLETNPGAQFWSEETGWMHMEADHWHGPVEYWNDHAVRNEGPWPRTHLIVDLLP